MSEQTDFDQTFCNLFWQQHSWLWSENVRLFQVTHYRCSSAAIKLNHMEMAQNVLATYLTKYPEDWSVWERWVIITPLYTTVNWLHTHQFDAYNIILEYWFENF